MNYLGTGITSHLLCIFSRLFVLCCADPCLSCQHHTVLITAVLSTISPKIRLIIISPIILFFINTIRAHLGTLLFYKNIKITFLILNRSLLVLDSMIRIALTLEINRIVEIGVGGTGMLSVSLCPVHELSISSKISGISLVNILQFSASKACTLFISKYLVVFILL